MKMKIKKERKNKHYLFELLNYLKISEEEFYSSLGWAESRLNGIIYNGDKITPQVAKSITDKYKNVTFEWLRTGKGKMIVKQKNKPGDENKKERSIQRYRFIIGVLLAIISILVTILLRN
jgi:plasmid maintenance system antidote protein VapI